jgi:hypothetical protein
LTQKLLFADHAAAFDLTKWIQSLKSIALSPSHHSLQKHSLIFDHSVATTQTKMLGHNASTWFFHHHFERTTSLSTILSSVRSTTRAAVLKQPLFQLNHGMGDAGFGATAQLATKLQQLNNSDWPNNPDNVAKWFQILMAICPCPCNSCPKEFWREFPKLSTKS